MIPLTAIFPIAILIHLWPSVALLTQAQRQARLGFLQERGTPKDDKTRPGCVSSIFPRKSVVFTSQGNKRMNGKEILQTKVGLLLVNSVSRMLPGGEGEAGERR